MTVFLSTDIFILVDLTFKVDIKAQNLSKALLFMWGMKKKIGSKLFLKWLLQQDLFSNKWGSFNQPPFDRLISHSHPLIEY